MQRGKRKKTMSPSTKQKKAIPLVLIALTCFALSPTAQAVNPPPDGDYPGFNTAEGEKALFSLSTGIWNTALGAYSLSQDTNGNYNTAVGTAALLRNVGDVSGFGFEGHSNTAVGAAALLSNTTGSGNTAVGVTALLNNNYGFANTALGANALHSNVGGSVNTAVGAGALYNNQGEDVFASGYTNTAVGGDALFNNQIGRNNTAIGASAGADVTGNGNVCIGESVRAFAGVDNTTWIRNIGTTPQVSGGSVLFVTVETAAGSNQGRLGYDSSSRRYKEDIKKMDKRSEVLFRLKPVTYRSRKEINPAQPTAFGLIAEEVAEVNPDLVVRNCKGQPESVHYQMVNVMLLNEFLKEHSKVEKLEATIAHQQKQIEGLTAGLQKVSAQIELSKRAPQTVLNNQ